MLQAEKLGLPPLPPTTHKKKTVDDDQKNDNKSGWIKMLKNSKEE